VYWSECPYVRNEYVSFGLGLYVYFYQGTLQEFEQSITNAPSHFNTYLEHIYASTELNLFDDLRDNARGYVDANTIATYYYRDQFEDIDAYALAMGYGMNDARPRSNYKRYGTNPDAQILYIDEDEQILMYPTALPLINNCPDQVAMADLEP